MGVEKGDSDDVTGPTSKDVPFNDAYQYVQGLLTVPLPLVEVMELSPHKLNTETWTFGVGSTVIIVRRLPWSNGRLLMA